MKNSLVFFAISFTFIALFCGISVVSAEESVDDGRTTVSIAATESSTTSPNGNTESDVVTVSSDEETTTNDDTTTTVHIIHIDENNDEICDICNQKITEGYIASGKCGDSVYWNISNLGVLKIFGSGAMDEYQTSSYYTTKRYVTTTKAITKSGSATTCETTVALTTTSRETQTSEQSTTVSLESSVDNTNATTSTENNTTEFATTNATTVTSLNYENYANWSSYSYVITGVVIEDGVTSIKNSAFKNCSNLKTAELPSSLKSIGDYAFQGCISLQQISIPENVTCVGYRAFYNCKNLSSLTILSKEADYYYNAFSNCPNIAEMYVGTNVNSLPNVSAIQRVEFAEGATCVPYRAFSKCANLTTVILPDTIRSIRDYAFYKCENLIEIYLPDSLLSVGSYAFDFTGLKELTFPNTLECIGDSAFANLGPVKELTIPEDVETIGYRAFANLTELSTINFNAQNAHIEDYCYSDVFANCGSNTDGINVVFGDNVECVPAFLFEVGSDTAIPKVISVKLGENVTKINEAAFCYCGYLENIELDDALTYIGESAFNYCVNLKKIEFPDNLSQIDCNAFNGCTGITDIELKNVRIIGSTAFNETSIEEITIPKTVEEIGRNAFYSDTLKTIYYNAENCDAEYAFSGNLSVTAVYIGETVNKLGAYTFQNLEALEKVYLPDAVIDISPNAFYNCGNMAIVCKDGSFGNAYAVQNGLRYIIKGTDSAFNIKNAFLTSYLGTAVNVVVPSDVTAIGNDAFSGNTAVETIELPYSVTKIYSGAFSDCSSLNYVIVPFTVTSIGDNAFTGSTKIYCYSGSYAYKYAKSNNIPYELITVEFTQTKKLPVNESVEIETETNVPLASGLPLVYKSSDVSVASITSGNTINGVSNGKATITASISDGTEVGTCEITVGEAAHEHSYTSTVVNEPTCTEAGSAIYKCSCGDTYTSDIPALGHADTNNDGYCDRCNKIVNPDIVYPCRNAKINIAATRSVDYKSDVTITATADNVPEGYHLELVYDGVLGAEGTNKEVTYHAGKITGNVKYTVQVVDAKGYVQQDKDGNDLKVTGQINCNANFFAKIIAFFKGLFGLLPTVTIKP